MRDLMIVSGNYVEYSMYEVKDHWGLKLMPRINCIFLHMGELYNFPTIRFCTIRL